MKILNIIHISTSHRLVHNILACTVSITLFLSGLCCASCNRNSQLTNELRKTALENEDTFNGPRRYLQKPVKVSSLNGKFTTVFTSLNHEIPSFRFSMSTYIRIFAQESITSSGEYRNEKIKTHNTYIKKDTESTACSRTDAPSKHHCSIGAVTAIVFMLQML